MTFQVRKAKRTRRPMKIGLEGLSGSGKTYTAIRCAFAMRRAGIGTRIAVADSENGSAELYADLTVDGERWEYEVCPIPPAAQNPGGYADVYEFLVGQGFDLIVIDSLSHAWHGAMEQVDAHAARNRGDKFGAWANVTPQQRRMLQILTDPRAHLIATMRVKAEYERVEGANGRDKIKKVGLKTDQREGTEYEFDAVFRLDQEHHITTEKVRGCTAMDGRAGHLPGPDYFRPLFDWWLAAKPLADELADLLRGAADLDALKGGYARVFQARQASQLTDPEFQTLTALKDARKGELSRQPAVPTAEDVFKLIEQLAKATDTTTDRQIATLFRELDTPASMLDDLSPADLSRALVLCRAAIEAAKGGGR